MKNKNMIAYIFMAFWSGGLCFYVVGMLGDYINPPRPHSVAWFINHPEEQRIAVKWCQGNPADVQRLAFGPQTCDHALQAGQP